MAKMGRPKKEYLESVTELLGSGIDQDEVIDKLNQLIHKGDLRAIELWFKYVYGSPRQQIDMAIKGELDLNFRLQNIVKFKE